ncbi:hypothetical protein SDC9_197271 [bioreactor metagenome]|uniref:Uncharacterized protein n=1 Tax=bioreactor metagenome TaxID=1076179 RepID=A0A645IGQ4_9ZZZZ
MVYAKLIHFEILGLFNYRNINHGFITDIFEYAAFGEVRNCLQIDRLKSNGVNRNSFINKIKKFAQLIVVNFYRSMFVFVQIRLCVIDMKAY